MALCKGIEQQSIFQVSTLQTGYAYVDQEGRYRARATTTLITGPILVIVDPGGAWEKDQVYQELKVRGLDASDISVVVGTHGHSDHIGNLNLFPNAKHIVGFDVNLKDEYLPNSLGNGEPYVLYSNYLEVVPTPGHTSQDVSLIVKQVPGYGTIGICGDLFESADDEGKWQQMSVLPELQAANRSKMRVLCDFIVPGHGSIFRVADVK